MSTRAIDILKGRLPKADQEVLPQMRAWHFFTAKVEQQEVINELYAAMIAAREESLDVGAWQDKARAVLEKYKLVSNPDQVTQDWDKYQNDVRNIDSLARIRLIFRVANDAAYGLSNWLDGMSPDKLRSFPCWRFDRVEGAKDPRPLHVANEKVIRPKWDFKFWADEMNAADIGGFEVPWAPFGFNSWMQIRPVHYGMCPKDVQDLVDKMTDEDFKRIAENADALYGTSLSAAYTESKGPVSVRKLSPEQREKLRAELEKEGIKVTMEGDKARVELEPKKKPEPTPVPKPAPSPVPVPVPAPTPKPEPKVEPKPEPKKKPEGEATPEPAPTPSSIPTPTPSPKPELKNLKEMPEAKTREESIKNTELLLDDADGVISWHSSVPKDMIDSYNETIFALKKKYPTNSLSVLGSYKDKKNGVGAHANGLKIELNHNAKKGGIHNLKDWTLYNKDIINKNIETVKSNIEKIKEYLSPVYDSNTRKWAQREIRQQKKQLKRMQESFLYERHNVGATTEGISIVDLVTHEYAHTLHYVASKNNRFDALMLVNPTYKRAIDNGDIYKMSEYASKNEMEFFAEAFTMRERKEKLPSYIDDMLTSIINRIQQ